MAKKPKTRFGSRKSSPKYQNTKVDCIGRPILLSPDERRRRARRKYPEWVAPDDMPDELVLDTLNGLICGEDTGGEGEGKYCVSRPANGVDKKSPKPWRCRKHKGREKPKPKKRTGNRMKYGLYGDALFEEERELWERCEADKIEEEIKMAKLRLRRALVAEKDAKKLLESEEYEEFEDGDKEVQKVKRRYATASKFVDQITNQLAKLYALRRDRQNALIEATSEGVKVYLPDNGRD